MATIIRKVAFENFYNYYGRYEDNEYEFGTGINIVSADNNMGKSKFYNGFLWLLEDRVYDSDIKGPVDAGQSLERMASGKAKAEDESFKVGFRVTFTNGDASYTVEKHAAFRRAGGELTHGPATIDVMETRDNRDRPVMDRAEREDIIHEVFLPRAIRPYALLQGESMDRLVDLSSKEALSGTIDALAGISTLKGVCEMARRMWKKAEDLYQKAGLEKMRNDKARQEGMEKRKRLNALIEKAEQGIASAREELANARHRKEGLEAYISNSDKRMRIRGKLDRARGEAERRTRAISETELSITSRLFDEDRPWLLMGLEDELEEYRKRRVGHIRDLANPARPGEPVPGGGDGSMVILLPAGSPDSSSLERMLERGVCEVCGQPAPRNSEAWEHIKLILNRPGSKPRENRNDFGVFYDSLEKSVSPYLGAIPKVMADIDAVREGLDGEREALEDLDKRLEAMFTELSNAGGGGDSSEFDDKSKLAEYHNATVTITRTERAIEEMGRNLNTWRLALAQEMGKQAGLDNDLSMQRNEDFARAMKDVFDAATETKERIFAETIAALESEANDKYALLTRGNQSSGGRLAFERSGDIVNVSIRDVRNGEITGLGTGFQRMKQLAIVMAVISSKVGGEKRFDYPFISDAPFSEFGENFMANFFDVAPRVLPQSIILIKELYDPNDADYLTPFGRKIMERMREGRMPGTFHVNEIREKADTTGLVTSHKRYV